MIQDHPLKVFYPYGGRHFIAVWWTHDEQNQIVVAKSLNALDKTLNIAIENNSDIELKEMWEVEIVAPPDKLCQIAKAEARKIEVNDFFRSIVGYLNELLENEIPIPEMFKVCDRWENDDLSMKEENDEHHWNCKNCVEKFSLKSLTLDEFYDKYNSNWNAMHNVPKYAESKALYGLAGTANENDELWCAEPQFGHHCNGTSLSIVSQDPEDYINTSSVLFYFHKIKEVDCSKYNQTIDEIKNKIKEKELLRREQYGKNFQKEKEKRFQKILDFFA